ncbi:MAG: pseudouridine synthase [Halothiobacillaceae bacterium]|nr:pseudouridine synthase [Halothiobacillaceae bacterium]
MQGERLQKVLAGWGLGSRRAIEQWIAAGEVKVNGEVATLGTRMLPTDRVEIRGQAVRSRVESFTRRVLMYHKPEGELTTRFDPEGRPTVFESLPPIRDGRWITVGRLDFNTSGLLIVTNDGELANRMMHPSQELLRVYAARIFGDLTPAMIKQLQEGVELEDGVAHFESVEDAGGTGMNHWYHVGLREGRNREVRRMFEAVGVPVSRLIRIQYGDLVLPPRLRPGKWNMLTAEEAEALAVSMKMPSKKEASDVVRTPRRASVRPAFPVARERDGESRGRAGERSRTPTDADPRRREPRAAGERKTYVVRSGRAERQDVVTATEGRPAAARTYDSKRVAHLAPSPAQNRGRGVEGRPPRKRG